jgi:two-component system, NarL family, nitrate/nitrite response regulator NarL
MIFRLQRGRAQFYCNYCTNAPESETIVAAHSAAIEGAGLASSPHSGTILIVDDDANYRAFVASILGRVGYGTCEAASGEEALTVARAERLSCVLLDVLLPGVTGYEVCRELRDEHGETLPIIFVTGERTEPGDRVAGLLLGADDYVVKPFDPDELLARVRRMIVRSSLAGRRNGGNSSRTLFDLTKRELQILAMLADGLSQRAIAEELVISPATVATHIQRTLVKLGAHSRAQAVAIAHREGMTRPPA